MDTIGSSEYMLFNHYILIISTCVANRLVGESSIVAQFVAKGNIFISVIDFHISHKRTSKLRKRKRNDGDDDCVVRRTRGRNTVPGSTICADL